MGLSNEVHPIFVPCDSPDLTRSNSAATCRLNIKFVNRRAEEGRSLYGLAHSTLADLHLPRRQQILLQLPQRHFRCFGGFVIPCFLRGDILHVKPHADLAKGRIPIAVWKSRNLNTPWAAKVQFLPAIIRTTSDEVSSKTNSSI